MSVSCLHCGGPLGQNHAVCDPCFNAAEKGVRAFSRRDRLRQVSSKERAAAAACALEDRVATLREEVKRLSGELADAVDALGGMVGILLPRCIDIRGFKPALFIGKPESEAVVPYIRKAAALLATADDDPVLREVVSKAWNTGEPVVFASCGTCPAPSICVGAGECIGLDHEYRDDKDADGGEVRS